MKASCIAMQTPLSRERRLPCCLTATVGVFMTAARPQSEAQEEEAFGREGDGTGGGVPAGLKECGRKCGLLKTWAQPQAPAAGSREPTGAHRPILGQRRPPCLWESPRARPLSRRVLGGLQKFLFLVACSPT